MWEVPEAMWQVPGSIVKIVSGDTYLVELDLGWHVKIVSAVRSATFDCPDISLPGGIAARKVAQHLLPFGAAVTVRSKKMLVPFGKYAFVLGEVEYAPHWAPLGEEGSFTTAMLASGHGQARTPR